MDGLVHARPASLLWLPLRFLSIVDIVAVSATSKAVRAASSENAVWYGLSSARWGMRCRRRWSEDVPGCWLRQYREWHACGRLPTGFLSGVSDTVLALSVRSTLAVWLCTPRGGDTRLSRGALRLPIGATDSTEFTLAVPPSMLCPPASIPLATSSLDDASSHPAGDSVEQFLLLKLVVQNLAEAALVVAASGVTLVLRPSTGGKSDGDVARPEDLAGARIPAMIPVGHCAVVAVNGVEAPASSQADSVIVAAGGFAVLRVAFSAPAWCASSAAAMSEPNALEHVAAVELCMDRTPLAPGSCAGGAVLTRLAVHDTWRHYRAAGRGLFVRVEPEEPPS